MSRSQQRREKTEEHRIAMMLSRDGQNLTLVGTSRMRRRRIGLICAFLALAAGEYISSSSRQANQTPASGLGTIVSAHVVLTRDDRGQSLVLTGEDGKGKGKGGGDRLVIAGHNMGGGGDGENSNMVMQDAANREGDVVIQGNSMIVPGEDGHIVLADGRGRNGGGGGGGRGAPPMPNLMAMWMPFMSGQMGYRMMPFYGGGLFGR